MLNYNHLFYFHVAATEGSLAAAAASLGVTQPTVSEQIRALERALSAPLFERTAGGLRLTETGRLAHEHTSVMFRAGERLVEALGFAPAALPRTLRVGISAAVARSVAADFLMPLFAIGDCVPSICTGDAVELVRMVRGGEIDLVLTESSPPESGSGGLEIVELGRSVLVAVGPPGLEPDESWQDVGLVQYRSSSSARAAVEGYLSEHHLRPRLVGEADDALLLIEAAARGGFIAFVPRSCARDPVAAGRLKIIAAMGAHHQAIHAVYQDGDSAEMARRAVNVLVEHLRATPD